MNKASKFWNDDKITSVMSTLLRVGLLTAASLTIFGGILFFIQHPKEILDYTTFKGEPDRLRQVDLIIREAFDFRGRPIIQLGLLLLIATPVVRVIFSFFGFLFEKDWVYVVITLMVLIILLISLFSNY